MRLFNQLFNYLIGLLNRFNKKANLISRFLKFDVTNIGIIYKRTKILFTNSTWSSITLPFKYTTVDVTYNMDVTKCCNRQKGRDFIWVVVGYEEFGCDQQLQACYDANPFIFIHGTSSFPSHDWQSVYCIYFVHLQIGVKTRNLFLVRSLWEMKTLSNVFL